MKKILIITLTILLFAGSAYGSFWFYRDQGSPEAVGGGAGGPSADAVLLESGDFLLLESGDYLLLE